MFEVTTSWKSAFPEAHAGVLVLREVTNPAQHPELEKHKMELEEQLRSRFSGQDRAAMSSDIVLQAYNNYYQALQEELSHPAAAGVHRLEGEVDPERVISRRSHVHGRDEKHASDRRA